MIDETYREQILSIATVSVDDVCERGGRTDVLFHKLLGMRVVCSLLEMSAEVEGLDLLIDRLGGES